MKIRQGFVSNSSSSSFVIALKHHSYTDEERQKEFNKFMEFCDGFDGCCDDDIIIWYTNLYEQGYYVSLLTVGNFDYFNTTKILDKCQIEYNYIDL